MFVGRSPELDFLEKQAEARGASFVPVYGRRRVGKTELLRRFAADRKAIRDHLARPRGPLRLKVRTLLHTPPR